MGVCDLCGKQARLKKVMVEGIDYDVCDECARFGTPLREIRHSRKKVSAVNTEVEVVDDDYSKIIRSARESRKLTQKEFARLLAVKESLLHSWEGGIHKPTLADARKIERILKVRLIKILDDNEQGMIPKTSDLSLTIGDIIKKK